MSYAMSESEPVVGAFNSKNGSTLTNVELLELVETYPSVKEVLKEIQKLMNGKIPYSSFNSSLKKIQEEMRKLLNCRYNQETLEEFLMEKYKIPQKKVPSAAKEVQKTTSYNDYEEHPRNLIPELLRQFYTLGWVSGTGGGISIKYGDEIYIAPSGVQKERVQPQDLFVQDINDHDICSPPEWKNLKKSECTPLFMNAFRIRGAGAVIHSHSKNAVLVTLVYPGNEFCITHQEMIKGIKKGKSAVNYCYDEDLIVPIIENTLYERELKDRMAKAMEEYPESNAILVRRHGIYVWGDTWEKAKTMCECYDYLFEIAVQMKQLGLDPTAKPKEAKFLVAGERRMKL
ncbi:methylthioribulose-1-phosphate dehydratase [Tachypleus tridentatus]|uniref:methylthioribulose-1-phosphate dehydratase n=1 Tax=Tachypleus tridentatus TaxID=6853 RepID=UPI003FD0DF8D